VNGHVTARVTGEPLDALKESVEHEAG